MTWHSRFLFSLLFIHEESFGTIVDWIISFLAWLRNLINGLSLVLRNKESLIQAKKDRFLGTAFFRYSSVMYLSLSLPRPKTSSELFSVCFCLHFSLEFYVIGWHLGWQWWALQFKMKKSIWCPCIYPPIDASVVHLRYILSSRWHIPLSSTQ